MTNNSKSLPLEFLRHTEEVFGHDRFSRFLEAFDEEPPVSIRLNPRKFNKQKSQTSILNSQFSPVPWCPDGFYLSERPNFTFDPLFHAGCYYVQEASSMFLDEIIRQLSTLNFKLSTLDLCAAPGGKSTLLRSALPEESILYSNEPIRNRASILAENVQKWGYANHIVTNNYPKDYRKSKLRFDIILCDVPCSGEGMFRKDEATIREWSPQNVEKCWKLQREIVADAWECLNEGGLLIYSTCTFNTKENEENIRWILSEYEAEVLKMETKPEWNITGSLLEGFNEPVYRFIPGITRGEGLFMCVLKKGQTSVVPKSDTHRTKARHTSCQSLIHVLSDGGTSDGKQSCHQEELSYPQAMAYLRHEALVLPEETPRGLVEVCFLGHPLGLVKNIGNRANNLYPKEWKIKTTYIPNEYEPILKKI